MKVSNSKMTIIMLVLLSMSQVKAADEVNSSFLGLYKLVENIEGECAENLEVKERKNEEYSLWLTYRNEANQFIGNAKYSDINAPRDSKTESCMTAGPVIPFCYETRKELTRYNKNTLVLESFFGRKSNYSKKARYKYSKIEDLNGNLKVTQLEMEKVLPLGVFTMTPIEVGATNTAYNPFMKITKHLVCTYTKN